MLFNSFTFAIFLAIVLPLYYALNHRWQNRLLLIASWIFYGWWDWRFLSLLILSSFVDYHVGRLLDRTENLRHRKLLLVASMVLNLGLLGTFKYFNFFVASFNELLQMLGCHGAECTLNVILPVGISFYTFQTMSYVVDVYRRQLKSVSDFPTFALFVGYFPQLVAGPIERAGHLLPRIMSKRTVEPQAVVSALQLMLMGYVKKIAIADSVAPFVQDIFSEPASQTSLRLLLGLYLFAIQIYGDFSGYSDIARGVSRLFGIELMVNFRQPYLAASITEFWHRWHISLSTWLRDYLYIPLGGNRHGTAKTYRNLMLTMLLGGLWHGAAWTFVIWGGLHGAALAVHKWLGARHGKRMDMPQPLSPIGYVLRVIATFHLVCLAWLFFRAESFQQAWVYLVGLGQGTFSCDLRTLSVTVFYLAFMLLIDLPCWARDREVPIDMSWPWYVRAAIQAACVVLISFVGASGASAFIYFQF